MFTKEDFVKYFNQMLELENRMEVIYGGIFDKVGGSYYKDFFKTMAEEEKAHGKIVEEMIKRFKG